MSPLDVAALPLGWKMAPLRGLSIEVRERDLRIVLGFQRLPEKKAEH